MISLQWFLLLNRYILFPLFPTSDFPAERNFPHIMKILMELDEKECSLEYTDGSVPGLISGRVILINSRPLSPKNLSVQLVGREKFPYCRSSSSISSCIYRQEVKVWTRGYGDCSPLTEAKIGNRSTTLILPGVHIWKFLLSLPQEDLCPTLNTELGSIRYSILASICTRGFVFFSLTFKIHDNKA